jgi:hypothetical protein
MENNGGLPIFFPDSKVKKFPTVNFLVMCWSSSLSFVAYHQKILGKILMRYNSPFLFNMLLCVSRFG